MSRARLVRELIPAAIFGAVVIGPARPATAALPTAEDYSFGTGSKVLHVKRHTRADWIERAICGCAFISSPRGKERRLVARQRALCRRVHFVA